MARLSSGLLLYRSDAGVEVLLAHMGGPFWRKRDAGGWSIPKGEHGPGEDSLHAARREFEEELGVQAPDGTCVDLGEVRQSSGKLIRVWALDADLDVSEIQSNTFELEWPRGSGKLEAFPEVDRAGWFEIDRAREKLVRGQLPFLDRLLERAGSGSRARLEPRARTRARGR
jgi:predicted NUDIX family NTP pyrophosphohydrolase